MTDCFLSHTQLTPPHSTVEHPTSAKSSSRLCVRFLGTVEKVCFVCMIPPTEHLIVLVHDVFERGLVRVIVNHYPYNVSEGVWVVHSDIVRNLILQEDIHGSM